MTLICGVKHIFCNERLHIFVSMNKEKDVCVEIVKSMFAKCGSWSMHEVYNCVRGMECIWRLLLHTLRYLCGAETQSAEHIFA